jgi:GMP synthase-like glutamine amidotransferase
MRMVRGTLNGASRAARNERISAIVVEEPGPSTTTWREDRDAWELALLDAAEEAALPTLGVCRGMQLMAVRAGGSLHQHTPDLVGHENHNPGGDAFGTVEVDLVDGSLVRALVGDRLSVHCHHHQSVREHPGFTAAAYAEDGTLEAMEVPPGLQRDRFCVAVQWHPEMAADAGLFRALVRAPRPVQDGRARPQAPPGQIQRLDVREDRRVGRALVAEAHHPLEGGEVAVLGDGKLGLLVALVLKAHGAGVHLFGRHREKMRIAESAGAIAHDAGQISPASFDWVVEATGSADGLRQAIAAARPRGTVIMKSTVHGEVAIDTAPAIVNEISLVGSRCGRFEPALELLRTGAVRPAGMVSARFPLAQAPEAFAKAAEKGTLKVLITA